MLDNKVAKELLWDFHNELISLSRKYGVNITPRYVDEIDYDYEENPFVSGTSNCLVLSDKDGNEITIRDITPDDLT